MQVKYVDPISILCDNTSAISISKNPLIYSNTNHILIKYKLLREPDTKKNIKLEYVGTKENIVGIFTKPLAWEHFEYL
jgi:hypothetical protein